MLSGNIPLVNVCSSLLSFHDAKVQKFRVSTKFFSKKSTKKHFVKNQQSVWQNTSSELHNHYILIINTLRINPRIFMYRILVFILQR